MMMAASPSDTKKKDSAADSSREKNSNCISPDVLDNAIEKTKEVESALDLARQAEQEAKNALKASQEELQALKKSVEEQATEIDSLRQSEEMAQESLRGAQNEVATLRNNLQKHTTEIEKSSTASERMVKLHEEMLVELAEINANSEKQFDALKKRIEAEMQRQREKMRIDKVSAERVDELEKEKAGYLGELKALHQLYDRLDKKYDAKMQEEEEEKLAYFAKSLDEEVAKIVGEREIEWETSIAELRNQSALALEQTKTEAQESLEKLREDLEGKAQREAEKAQQIHEKEVAALEQKIVEAETALAKELERASMNLSEVDAAHAKELELAEINALKRLDELRKTKEAEAAKEAARVQKLHDAEIASLKVEIRKAQDETRLALEKSEQIDSNLRLTNEERDNQRREYEKAIDALRKELAEAREVSRPLQMRRRSTEFLLTQFFLTGYRTLEAYI